MSSFHHLVKEKSFQRMISKFLKKIIKKFSISYKISAALTLFLLVIRLAEKNLYCLQLPRRQHQQKCVQSMSQCNILLTVQNQHQDKFLFSFETAWNSTGIRRKTIKQRRPNSLLCNNLSYSCFVIGLFRLTDIQNLPNIQLNNVT